MQTPRLAVETVSLDPAAIPIPNWLRLALQATAVMNLVVGAIFFSGSPALLGLSGFPAGVPPFYPMTVGLFVALFGLGYGFAAVASRPERLFIALAGAGKLSFVALVTALWLGGGLPAQAALSASADLPFGVAFVGWILATRR